MLGLLGLRTGTVTAPLMLNISIPRPALHGSQKKAADNDNWFYRNCSTIFLKHILLSTIQAKVLSFFPSGKNVSHFKYCRISFDA